MKKTQRAMERIVWRVWKRIDSHPQMVEGATGFVISGFPRSGTSVVAQVAAACGISFGFKSDLKEARDTNPRGFLENLRLFRIVDAMLWQAKLPRSYAIPLGTSVRAKGLRRLARPFSRRALGQFLKDLSSSESKRWGIKMTPLACYFLPTEIPMKVIGVFREPYAAVHSNMKIFGNGEPFSVMLEYWRQTNQELLYRLSIHESILVDYDRLTDPDTQMEVLDEVRKFIGCEKSLEEIAQVIVFGLNRSSAQVEKLKEAYPLDRETQNILDALRRKAV